MLTPAEITQPGRYWYYVDIPDSEPQLVDIRAGQDGLQVHFAGRDDYDMVAEVSGRFQGPVQVQAL